jgi:hypothetical protein
MTKLLALGLLIVGFASAAAQPAGSAAPTAAGSAAPAAAGSAAPAPLPMSPAEARAACVAAMNADRAFAARIIQVADKEAADKRDADTIAAHEDAVRHVQKNERHVIYAYAALWIVAAAFVLFLWRRQQALQGEIAQLRRDLDAAEDPSGKAKA